VIDQHPHDVPEGWENTLAEGETILWQGRPVPGIGFSPAQAFTTLFGLVFTGFAVFWMVQAARVGGLMWTFGLIHFTAGLGVLLGPIFLPAYMRKKTWYTLTNQKAYIADIPILAGKRLRSYPITKDTPIEIKTGTYTTINFASALRHGKNNRVNTVPIGFERLTDGDIVRELIHTIQKDTL
jgi:hypothetical protein